VTKRESLQRRNIAERGTEGRKITGEKKGTDGEKKEKRKMNRRRKAQKNKGGKVTLTRRLKVFLPYPSLRMKSKTDAIQISLIISRMAIYNKVIVQCRNTHASRPGDFSLTVNTFSCPESGRT